MPTPTHLWTVQFGSRDTDYIHEIATDEEGNVYICGGTFNQVAPSGPVGTLDAYFAKYDPQGNRSWIHQLGSGRQEQAHSIEVDKFGNSYIVGYTTGNLKAGAAKGKSDIFVMKYDTFGNQEWIRQWGTEDIETALGVSLDRAGNILICGFTLNGPSSDIFLTQLNATGEIQWTRSMDSGRRREEANDVATDQENNVYICGFTDGQLEGALAEGWRDAFLAKHDENGQREWTIQIGSSKNDSAESLAVDLQGNILICGYTDGVIESGQEKGGTDAFVAKYNAQGEQQWMRQFGTNKYDRARGIATDQFGNIFVAGQTAGKMSATKSADSYHDAFLVKFDPLGRQQWVQQLGTATTDKSTGITTDKFGNIIICGESWGEMVNSGPHGGVGTSNPFVSKFQDIAATHLVVPLHLNGIYIDSPTQTVGPSTDFTYLPWNDGQQDHNPDYAPLGEHITTTPLQSANGELQAGIHLHWTLPHCLSSFIKKEDGSQVLPYVPVKWDIVPMAVVGTDSPSSTRLWSDALWPKDALLNQKEAVVPVPYRPGSPAYRYMGRTGGISDSEPTKLSGEGDIEYYHEADYHARPLDCLGYGSMHFAPFYPNCREVFGHYEPLDGDEDLDSLCYFVSTKLYQQGDDSLPINQLINDTGLSLIEILEQMDLPLNILGELPEEISLAGTVKIDTNHSHATDLQTDLGNISFGIGNTGTEALSALLASELASLYGNNGDKAEEQLEAILMHDKISGRSADLGLQFLEQRHRQGFRKFSGGTEWEVALLDRVAIQDALLYKRDGMTNSFRANLSGFDRAKILLDRYQRAYDQQKEELESLQTALFGDWYKYMLTKYPAPETEAEFDSTAYPQTGVLGAWTQHRAAKVARVKQQLSQSESYIQSALVRIRGTMDILKKMSIDNPILLSGTPGKSLRFKLSQHPTQPYYQPTDPVVLIEGLEIEEPKLKQASPDTQHYIHNTDLNSGTPEEQAQKLFAALYPEADKIPSQTGWNPFILEWEAEYLPALDSYGEKAPQNNFELDENQPEIQIKTNEGYRSTKASVLRGRTFLSPGAKLRKQAVLADFLKRKLAGEEAIPDLLLPVFIKEYVSKNGKISADDDAVLTAARAYLRLNNMTILSQGLGGFTEGLLQRETYEQPPLGDPLGTEQEQDWSSAIGQLVGRAAKYGPKAENPFSPVRAGSFQLIGLRLIDTWGRYRDLLKEQGFVPAIAQPLRTLRGSSSKPTWPTLPLRLSQPLRLHFNWLKTTTATPGLGQVYDAKYYNTIQETSPVLGWLGTSHLAQNLQFFYQRGDALGYFNREATSLLPPPGMDSDGILPLLPPALEQIMERVAGNPSWLKNFLEATNSALEKIAPDESQLNPGISILTGRPIGVARIRLHFELKGNAAQPHGWDILKEQIKNWQGGGDTPDSNWDNMKFPVRLGNYGKLNDGLIGYWLTDERGQFQGPLNTMAAQTEGAGILPHSQEQVLWLPLDGTAVNVTVLFDPRGSIHATSGVLPVQSIRLKQEHFDTAINKISSWFLTAPLLQPEGVGDRLMATPPPEPGYRWSWLQKELGVDPGWRETSTFNATNERATLQNKVVLKEGWLKLSPDPDAPDSSS